MRLRLLEGLRTPDGVARNRGLVDAALADADPGVQAAAVDGARAARGSRACLPIDPGCGRPVRYAGPAPDVAIEAIAAAEARATDPAAPRDRGGRVPASHPSWSPGWRGGRSSGSSTPIPRPFRGGPTTAKSRGGLRARRGARSAENPTAVVRIETERGTFVLRLAAARGAADGPELRHARAPRILRRDPHPPRRPGLRRPGRRPDGNRQRRPRLRDPRRAQPDPLRDGDRRHGAGGTRTPAAASGS